MADQSSRHEAAPGRLPNVNSILFKELCQRPRTFYDVGPLAYRLSEAAMSFQSSETE